MYAQKQLEAAALRLDQYYIPTRYPDAQPAGARFDFSLQRNRPRHSSLPLLFEDLHGLYPRLDLLVYTDSELADQLSESVGFWASVKSGLRELPVDSSSLNGKC